MEVINLDMVDLSGGGDDSNTITLNKGDSIRMDSSPGMSMAGAELLMNHNTKKTSDQKEKEKDPSIELDDLTSLENDLNSLTIGGADKLNISGSNEPIKLNIGSVDDAPKSSESSSGPT
ncbi:MAG: hypothetical protein ACR2M6_00990, partial [Vampirovibrionia bacterium]